MNIQQAELYQRIQAFSLDEPDAGLTFSKRLARDNGWTVKYTQRVIDEYKKFVFLAVAAGHPVTPSDQVDQVWHLHLIYTHSYWGEFCPNVLQTPLHHGPTRGGKSEQHKFNDWYSKTLASYESFFDQTPPADIWPPAHIRFGRDVHFRRVNTQQTWLLSKFHLNRVAITPLLFLFALSVTACEPLIVTNIGNPLDFQGREFLSFYLSVASTVTLFAYFLRWYLRQPAKNASGVVISLDPYETAYLAGGQNRAIDAAIMSLIERGHLKYKPELRTLVPKSPLPHNSHPLEQAIEQAARSSGEVDQVRVSVANATDQICNHLKSLNLLMTESQNKAAQKLPAIGVFAVLLLGISKILVGISRDKPVGFLVVLCMITAIIGCCFLCVPVFRTRYGDRVLADLKARYVNEKQTKPAYTMLATDPQLVLAFGLFGTVGLAESFLIGLRKVLAPSPNSADGGGGGGCGGCGGCGGGGDSGGGS